MAKPCGDKGPSEGSFQLVNFAELEKVRLTLICTRLILAMLD